LGNRQIRIEDVEIADCRLIEDLEIVGSMIGLLDFSIETIDGGGAESARRGAELAQSSMMKSNPGIFDHAICNQSTISNLTICNG
jgi:hypothetical protein